MNISSAWEIVTLSAETFSDENTGSIIIQKLPPVLYAETLKPNGD